MVFLLEVSCPLVKDNGIFQEESILERVVVMVAYQHECT